jgi:hypothetical protein
MNKSESEENRLGIEGWSKRFVASEPRLSEAVEMYQEAGFEVHLEPLPKEPECDGCVGTEEEDDCRICFEGTEDLYKIIFTRAKEGKIESEDDLF